MAESSRADRSLLLYLTSTNDLQRCSVGPALAAMAEAAGWAFEIYVDGYRAGRHFGAGAPEDARPGWPDGSLVVGGAHALAASSLATSYAVAAIGDERSVLWPVLDELEVESIARTSDPAAIQLAALARLEVPTPAVALVLDATPQGSDAVVTAPFLYPRVLAAGSLAIDVSSNAATVSQLAARGVTFRAVACDPGRLARFPVSVASDATETTPGGSWGAVTAELATGSEAWGRGVFVGDPDLVAAHLAKASRLRLLPLYGRPTADVVERVPALVERASEPIFGRQWDDHDFFLLAERGHGLNVVDPPPPFDVPRRWNVGAPAVDAAELSDDPPDEQLEQWAADGRVLATLLFWTGMLRELDGLPRLVDLVAATRIRAGFIVTAETVEHLPIDVAAALSAPSDRGGVAGHVELLLGSTGRGVAAEHRLPAGALEASLRESLPAFDVLPSHLRPEGWWPLLDTSLRPVRSARIGLEDGRPVVWFTPRCERAAGELASGAAMDTTLPLRRRPDARRIVGEVLRRTGASRVLEARRPFQDSRPGPLDCRVAGEVASAGLSYMWTKADFGRAEVSYRSGSFVALPFTAGGWDGWSPFYTVRSRRSLEQAAGRLRRAGRPGWVVSTVDSPLFVMSGEVLEHGGRLHDIASAMVDADSLGVINVLPRTIARYARIIDGLRSGASTT